MSLNTQGDHVDCHCHLCSGAQIQTTTFVCHYGSQLDRHIHTAPDASNLLCSLQRYIRMVSARLMVFQSPCCHLIQLLYIESRYYGVPSVTKLCFQGYFINYDVTL